MTKMLRMSEADFAKRPKYTVATGPMKGIPLPEKLIEAMIAKPSKFRNTKCTDAAGNKFDSKRELTRWRELLRLENDGWIEDLKRQVRFKLLPAQRRADGKTERGVSYIADFTYLDNQTGNRVYTVADAKGMQTDIWILKRKLMLFIHGITVKET